MDELERALVGRTSLVDAIEPAQQLGARCVQIVVRVELEAVDQCERSLDLARFGHGCGLVQLHDRRAGSAGELVVESRELRPVLGLLDVQGRNGRLEHVGVAAAERERTVERGSSLRDLVEIPARAILVAKQDDRAVGDARLAPGVVDQHECQEPLHLRLVGHELGERAPEPDRLDREVSAAAVALVEDQVDDGEHRGEAVR